MSNSIEVEGKKRPKLIVEDVPNGFGGSNPGRIIWCSLSIWSYENPYDICKDWDELTLEHKNGDRWCVYDCRVAPIDEIKENPNGDPALNQFCVVFSRAQRLKREEARVQ